RGGLVQAGAVHVDLVARIAGAQLAAAVRDARAERPAIALGELLHTARGQLNQPFVVRIVGQHFGHTEIVEAADVGLLRIARAVLGLRRRGGDLVAAALVAHADARAVAVVLVRHVGRVLAQVVLGLAEEALGRGHEVADGVRRAGVRRAGNDVRGIDRGAHAGGGSRFIVQVVVLRREVAAHAQFAPGAAQAQRGAAIEREPLGARRVTARLVVGIGRIAGAVVGVHAGFEPESRPVAAAELLGAPEAQTRRGQARVPELGLVGDAAGAALQGDVDNAEQLGRGLGGGEAAHRERSGGDE